MPLIHSGTPPLLRKPAAPDSAGAHCGAFWSVIDDLALSAATGGEVHSVFDRHLKGLTGPHHHATGVCRRFLTFFNFPHFITDSNSSKIVQNLE